jgi:hypothetical protein
MAGDPVGFVFGFIALLLGLSILGNLVRRITLHRGGRAEGEVVDVELTPGLRAKGIGPHVYYRPIVRYRVAGRDLLVAGEYLIQHSETTVRVRTGDFMDYETKTGPLRYHRGQSLQVIYNPSDPAQARILDPLRERRSLILHSIFGGLFTLIGIVVIRLVSS